MTRRLFAFARWRLDPTGVPMTRITACQTCPERSEPSPDLVVVGRWAMAHAGLTGHRGFDEITTASLRASLEDGPAVAGAQGLTEVVR
ncbi:DUF7848 domain-containing protein [Streptomyces zaomyceticus]